MNQSITDKRFIVGLRGGYKVYINEQQKDNIILALETNQTFIKYEGGLFRASEVNYILLADQIEKEDRIKRGEWQCKDCGRWHGKFEDCGCQGGKY